MGKKESAREEDVTVASLRSLDVNGITPAQMLPLIRILKVRGCTRMFLRCTMMLRAFGCRRLLPSNYK